jgi:hypothetical protein
MTMTARALSVPAALSTFAAGPDVIDGGDGCVEGDGQAGAVARDDRAETLEHLKVGLGIRKRPPVDRRQVDKILAHAHRAQPGLAVAAPRHVLGHRVGRRNVEAVAAGVGKTAFGLFPGAVIGRPLRTCRFAMTDEHGLVGAVMAFQGVSPLPRHGRVGVYVGGVQP